MARTNLWEEYLKGELGRTSKVQSGMTPMWETPEYKSIAQGLQTQYGQNLSEAEKVLAAKGLTGGAAANVYSNLLDKRTSSELDAINKIGAYYSGQGKELATQGANREAEYMKSLMGMYANLKGAKMAEQKWGKSYGSTCCFIMAETDDLTQKVREFRDSHYSQDSYVGKGYKMMAKWLVPIMRRNRIIKVAVNLFLTHPIALFAEHYGNNKKIKATLYGPVGLFWTTFWNMTARFKVAIS